MRRRLGLVGSVGVLASCSGLLTPVPPDKVSYIGTWSGADVVELSIAASGAVRYEEEWHTSFTDEGGSEQTALRGQIQFTPTGFDVGIGPVVLKSFQVSVPPHLNGDVWTMTVDGDALTRR